MISAVLVSLALVGMVALSWMLARALDWADRVRAEQDQASQEAIEETLGPTQSVVYLGSPDDLMRAPHGDTGEWPTKGKEGLR